MNFFIRQGWALLIAAVIVAVCVSNAAAQGATGKGTFTDERDGKIYKTVKFGGKTWMGENLNYQASSGAWCYGNNNSTCDEYGMLYDWKTAWQVCPAGWHLPSRREWGDLAKAAGGTGDYGNGGTAGAKLKSVSGWDNKGNGTDGFGFSALPGGSRAVNGGFDNAGNRGIWWTASEFDRDSAYYRRMGNNYAYVYEGNFGKGAGFYVRCVEGTEAEEGAFGLGPKGEFTDKRDGKTYKTVKIRNQTWMAENLNYQTSSGSWCYGNNNSNCDKYGRLYDWKTAMKACPKGWHLSSSEEWDALETAVGGSSTAGMKLKTTTGWAYGGTDAFGFSALSGGARWNDGWDPGSFSDGESGYWWTATEYDVDLAYFRVMLGAGDDVEESKNNKYDAVSVRCVGD